MNKSRSKIIEITEFTDPVCTWCWGSEPVLRKLETRFGEQGILVIVFAAASPGTLDARELLARHVATLLTAGTIMLAVALAVAVALIVRPRKAADR